jgi:hypothetical protein
MTDDYSRSIDPLIAIGLGCIRWKAHGFIGATVRRMINRRGEDDGEQLRELWIRQKRAMRGL